MSSSSAAKSFATQPIPRFRAANCHDHIAGGKLEFRPELHSLRGQVFIQETPAAGVFLQADERQALQFFILQNLSLQMGEPAAGDKAVLHRPHRFPAALRNIGGRRSHHAESMPPAARISSVSGVGRWSPSPLSPDRPREIVPGKAGEKSAASYRWPRSGPPRPPDGRDAAPPAPRLGCFPVLPTHSGTKAPRLGQPHALWHADKQLAP